LLFPVPFPLALGRPLIILPLALREADGELDPSAAVVEVERNKGIARPFHFSDEPPDFLRMKEEFAAAGRVGADVRGGRFEWADVAADEEHFPTFQHDIGLFQLGTASADGLDLPTLQREPRLEALLDEVIVCGCPGVTVPWFMRRTNTTCAPRSTSGSGA